MKRSIIKSLLVLAITSGCVFGLLAMGEGIAKDKTKFTKTSNGDTVIDHRGRDGSGGSVVTIDHDTGTKKTTTSN